MIMRWRKVFCCIFLFVGLAMFGMGCSGSDGTDDETDFFDEDDDTCSTARAVNLNYFRYGHINSPEDIDYFRVDVTSSGTLKVYTETLLGRSLDTYGYLKNSDCTDLAYSDDGGKDDNFSISRSVTTGTYYVAVKAHHYTDIENDYFLNVDFSEDGPTDDHGDDCSTATPVSLYSPLSGSIETAGDIDYFRVDVTSSGTLTVYTTGSTDTYGIIQDMLGILVTDDNDSAGDYSYNFFISQYVGAGTYYLGIMGGVSGATGNYTLYVDFQ